MCRRRDVRDGGSAPDGRPRFNGLLCGRIPALRWLAFVVSSRFPAGGDISCSSSFDAEAGASVPVEWACMDPGEEVEMDTEEEAHSLIAAAVPFQLQLDKPIPSPVCPWKTLLYYFLHCSSPPPLFLLPFCPSFRDLRVVHVWRRNADVIIFDVGLISTHRWPQLWFMFIYFNRSELLNGIRRRIFSLWSRRIPRFSCTVLTGRGSGPSLQVWALLCV